MRNHAVLIPSLLVLSIAATPSHAAAQDGGWTPDRSHWVKAKGETKADKAEIKADAKADKAELKTEKITDKSIKAEKADKSMIKTDKADKGELKAATKAEKAAAKSERKADKAWIKLEAKTA
jgi:hypothetical protein